MAKQVRDPESRERIVVAARRLVAVQGVHASTMRAIAAEAGVTTGAVTHYFADKADVMTAVIRYNNELIARTMVQAAAGMRGLPALEAAMDSLLPLEDEMLRSWTVLIAFWGQSPAKQFVLSEGSSLGYLGLRAYVMALLGDAVEDGDVPADTDIEHEAERVIALVGGIGMMVGGFPDQRDAIRRRARTMLSELITALKA